ncbi:MAG: oligosaccharide flippase family protein [Actinomycetota bacterium]|nr:oligosaccharide flippase family protein [Actinomycetota bacterium]
MLNTAISRFGTVAIGIVLARALGPEQFGTFAVALVALIAVLSLNELGVSLAIVRWPGDPRRIAATVTTISFLGSLLFCVAGELAAPAFTEAMGNPQATGVVRLLLLSVLVDGLVATPAALLQREFRQKTRMWIDQTNVWTGAIVSLVLAIAGFGAVSLAIGRIMGSVLSAGLFIRNSPLPFRFGFDRHQLGKLLRFGMPLAGASLIVFCVGYADQLVAGQVLGSTMLGFYVLAFNLSGWPVSIFSQPLRNVAPAAFARLQHDPPTMQAAMYSIVGLMAAVTLPPFAFLVGSAGSVVRLVYGEQWAPAAAALSWLVGVAALRTFYELSYDYLVVLGHSGSILTVQVYWLAFLVPALIAGAHFAGLGGLAIGQFAVAVLVVLPIYLWKLKSAGVKTMEIGSRVWLPMIVGVGIWILSWVIGQWIVDPVPALMMAGLPAIAVSGILVYGKRHELSSLRRLGTSEESDESLELRATLRLDSVGEGAVTA